MKKAIRIAFAALILTVSTGVTSQVLDGGPPQNPPDCTSTVCVPTGN